MIYDFIVIGAGSAGAALANRLSADPKNKVLLLEAGAADHPWTRIPVGYAKLLRDTDANWMYTSEPEPATNGRRLPVPRGKLLGGSSAINGLAFVRGQAQDFDTWAQMGNQGWSYADVLPVFKRMENYQGGGDDHFRGRGGPLKVTDPQPSMPLFQALIKAAGQVGIRHNPDYNGEAQDGIAMSQATIARGWRMSTARAYLNPARKRSNLHIETSAHTEALLFDDKRCVGVRWSKFGKMQEANSRRDTIVCAGSINSPQLLELSGIGQPDRLKAVGIEVRHALPGVGENLRDHYAPRTRWIVGQKGMTYNDTARGFGFVRQTMRWMMFNEGLLGAVAAPIRAFVCSREGLAAPDLLLGWVPMFTDQTDGGPKISKTAGFTCYAHVMRPESRGSIHVTSADAKRAPAIRFNFLSTPVDVELTVKAIRIARSIMLAPAMAPLMLTEQAPGPNIETDEEIVQWVKAAGETTYHPVGTCKMGTDPLAVVDPKLRVHGIANLRVADASIMPTLTSGNTNAPSIMIGERAADLVLAS